MNINNINNIFLETAKPATTDFSVAEELSSCSFVVLAPNTGRTHQLRGT